MGWDIGLAVLAFLVQGVLVYWGLRESRRGNVSAFWILLSVGVVVTIFTIVRSVETPAQIANAVAQGMDAARRLEGPHIHVRQFGALPFIVGQEPSVNVYFTNDGAEDTKIKVFHYFALTEGAPANLQAQIDFENKLFALLQAGIPAAAASAELQVPRKAEQWLTAIGKGHSLTKEQAARLKKGESQFYMMGVFRRVVGFDRPDVEFCVHWSKPDTLMYCQVHNKED
jgi:hypothetical protein